MRCIIITHVPHVKIGDQYFAYAPYVCEMNLWAKYVDEFIIVAPIVIREKTEIDLFYAKDKIRFFEIPAINFSGYKAIYKAVFNLPRIIKKIYNAMQQAEHIHLRCPGNVGLLGCLIQIFFPNKTKTAKYAGNWDPKAKQPLSYRLQKMILSNTFFTRNMQVLVYGEWERSTKNILPFFTATYSNADKQPLKVLHLKKSIHFIFVGTLTSGKNPLYAIQLVRTLAQKGIKVHLNIYGDGAERGSLETYILENNLKKIITTHGNQNKDTITKGYQDSHFVVLPSKSEGWPKVLAEGMFWGCVPVATSVSCVPFMLNHGKRGLLLKMNLEQDVLKLENLIQNESDFTTKRHHASQWSRRYTLDLFEKEIKKLVQ
jgi:glycosyltransferase involved in cell wall biosynthesis